MSSRRGGFSLVELLVVIGIIAVLLGILLPSLSRAKDQARSARCAANLHAIGIAIFNYTVDNRGNIPAWSGWHTFPDGTGPEDDPGPAWTEQLMTKIGALPNSPVYDCPAFPENTPMNYFITGRWSYSMGSHSIKLSQVKLASLYIMGGECTNRQEYVPGFGTLTTMHTVDIDKDDAAFEQVIFAGAPGGLNVHGGGNNVMFSDGHVAMFRAFVPASMTYDGTQLKSWAEVRPN